MKEPFKYDTSYYKYSRSCHGHATLADGTAYSLEYCGDGEHVFKQYDTSQFPAHETIDEGIM